MVRDVYTIAPIAILFDPAWFFPRAARAYLRSSGSIIRGRPAVDKAAEHSVN